MAKAIYAIAIGSNRRGRVGGPRANVRAAVTALGAVVAVSTIVTTVPLGQSRRRYANAVALIASAEEPDALLVRLKTIERRFGRRRGRRWGDRVLDLDIVLWSEGCWAGHGLIIPHPDFRDRGFVLGPLRTIAPDWRDPVTNHSVRQLAARLARPRPPSLPG